MSLAWKQDCFSRAKLSYGGGGTSSTRVCFGTQHWLKNRPMGNHEAGPCLQNVFVTYSQSRSLPVGKAACLWAAPEKKYCIFPQNCL